VIAPHVCSFPVPLATAQAMLKLQERHSLFAGLLWQTLPVPPDALLARPTTRFSPAMLPQCLPRRIHMHRAAPWKHRGDALTAMNCSEVIGAARGASSSGKCSAQDAMPSGE